MKKVFYLLFVFLAGCVSMDPSVEIGKTLTEMNQAYQDKNVDTFMSFVSADYEGQRDVLQIAVENDFAGFLSVNYRTSVFQTVYNEKTGRYMVSVYYFRTAQSPRHGVDNQSGDVILTFVKDENGGFKLINMSEPLLYGLIVP